MTVLWRSLSLIIGLTIWGDIAATSNDHYLEPVVINRRDIAAQQRGAATFFQYCAGCHSLKQMRYTDLAYHFGWQDQNGEPDHNMIFEYLNFINDQPASPILTSLDPIHAEQWFGKMPPDLSLVIRSRSPEWIAGLLKGFYPDSSQPNGVGNDMFPAHIAMPHVLIEQEGWAPYSVIEASPDRDHALLRNVDSQDRYNQVVRDLIHFLDYVAEPHRLQRETMGKYVLLFLIALSCLNYLYYRSVWDDQECQEDESNRT